MKLNRFNNFELNEGTDANKKRYMLIRAGRSPIRPLTEFLLSIMDTPETSFVDPMAIRMGLVISYFDSSEAVAVIEAGIKQHTKKFQLVDLTTMSGGEIPPGRPGARPGAAPAATGAAPARAPQRAAAPGAANDLEGPIESPAEMAKDDTTRKRVLRARLKKCLRAEKFERATEIRDRLKSLGDSGPYESFDYEDYDGENLIG